MTRHRFLPTLLVASILLFALGTVVILESRNDEDYTDQVVAAADGGRVSTLPEGAAGRWSDNGGPTWEKAQTLIQPGNSRLASVFDEASNVARERDGRAIVAYPHLECMYWPVVPSEGDPVEETESLLRMCYQSTKPAGRPYSITGMAIQYD